MVCPYETGKIGGVLDCEEELPGIRAHAKHHLAFN